MSPQARIARYRRCHSNTFYHPRVAVSVPVLDMMLTEVLLTAWWLPSSKVAVQLTLLPVGMVAGQDERLSVPGVVPPVKVTSMVACWRGANFDPPWRGVRFEN
jgi:hypothetical protein